MDLKVGASSNWLSISSFLLLTFLFEIESWENFDAGDLEPSEFLDLAALGDLDRDFFSSSTYLASYFCFGDFEFLVGWDEEAVYWDETEAGWTFLAGDRDFCFWAGDFDFGILKFGEFQLNV